MATQARIALEPDGLVAVLDHVRAHGASSRAELAQATGLGRSVLTQRVDALLDHGLLAEDGVGVSTGGRAPRLLRFRADAGYLLVADLGATSTDVALADLAGEILVAPAGGIGHLRPAPTRCSRAWRSSSTRSSTRPT